MVGFLTYGNKKFHHLDDKMRRLLEPLYHTMKELIPFVDADAAAFNDYMVSALSTDSPSPSVRAYSKEFFQLNYLSSPFNSSLPLPFPSFDSFLPYFFPSES